MSSWRKIVLILWKNWLLRRRHYIVTAFEIILPTLFAIMLYFTLGNTRPENERPFDKSEENIRTFEPDAFLPKPDLFSSYHRQSDPFLYPPDRENITFLYSPDTRVTRDLLKYFPKYLEIFYGRDVQLIGVDNEEMIDTLTYEGYFDKKNDVQGAVVFVGENLKRSIPNRLHYKIRLRGFWGTSEEYTYHPDHAFAESIYLHPGKFLVFQHLIAIRYTEILRKQDGLLSQINITAQRFPRMPEKRYKDNSDTLNIIIPLFITLSFLFTAPTIIFRIVREKDTGIRELMKTMGLPNWAQWFGWFISNFILMAISTIIIVVLLCLRKSEKLAIFNFSDPVLIYIIMILYVASAICFCFFITSFFSRPSIATIVGVILWIVTFCVPYFTLFEKYYKLTLSSKMALGLLPNMALAWAIRIVVGFERKKVGIHWSNLNVPSFAGDNLTMGHVILIIIVDIALYSLLTWYFDHVLPGKYGVSKPWYFLFTKAYWVQNKSSVECETSEIEDSDKFESEPVGLSPVIVIKKLTKSFGANKLAVDHLSLKIYEGQITALLGHNGAGKTTTMSMLTGMYSPTSGTAIINGYDIRTEMDVARNDLGLCPQHNMLFEKLTVREHLIFFGSLKKSSGESLTKEVDSLLNKLQLWEKRNDLAGNLSGGMKRKLNLGIALVGESKIVILDEPTSGMDPEARRAIWDLLQEYRTGRCILLSTHFMEEADVLGDRIAIMARGQIECCGTPLFLKKRYGAGYHLTLNITNNDEMMNISNMIHRCVPTSYLENNTEGELSFVLPPNESHRFVSLFEQLETSAESLGIKNFGLSVTTLEEVFLKVGETAVEKNKEQSSNSSLHSLEIENEILVEDKMKNTGFILWLQQFYGLLLKHFYYVRKRPFLLLAQILVPVFMSLGLVLALNSNFSVSSLNKEPPLLMDISKYGPTVSFANYNESDELIASLGKSYESSFPSTTTVDRVNDSLNYLLEFGQRNFAKYRNQILLGTDFSLNNSSDILINIWYNNFYQSLPLGLNLVHNAIVKTYTKNDKYSILVENAPLPNNPLYGPHISENVFSATIVGIFIPIGLSILSSSFVIFLIHERATKCKHLQFMTGISGFAFWSSSFLWDFLINLISLCFVIIVFATVDKTYTFVGQDKLEILFLIFLAYAWCSIPFTYLNSFIFRVPAAGLVFVTIINLISGTIMSLGVFFKEYNNEEIFAHWFCNLFPNFSVTVALMNFVIISNKNNQCQNVNSILLENVCRLNNTDTVNIYKCCPPDVCGENCFKPLSYFHMDYSGIGRDLTMLIIFGFVFFLLLLALETNLCQKIGNYLYIKFTTIFYVNCSRKGKVQIQNGGIEETSEVDDDVVAEKERIPMLINQSRESSDLFIVHDLVKEFWNLVAVDNLSFAVANGQCFGLLGINGAGKTTTFQMLTGDLSVTKGNAFIRESTLTGNRSKYLSNISYCPQFDALLDHLTGRELLTVFAHLHGISRSQIKTTVYSYLTDFGLMEHADKITVNYSGGNKRKLSAAIAFIGQTPVVFLDEPTTGVDPMARRKIWGRIQEANSSGMSIVLTSHSMEECEVLCSRVAIMVNGQFQCIGGIQHLKNKFSQGFTILAKLNRNTTEANEQQENVQKELQRFIEEKFPSASLKDVHQGLVHYQITDVNTKWSYLFSTMEEAKARFKLEDYSVSQATLEQVFLSFAGKQRSTDKTS